MGWLGVATPETHGGIGLRVSSIAVLAEAAGAMFLNEPLADTAFSGAYLVGELGSAAQQALFCPRICDGTLRLAVALEPPEQLPASSHAVTADDGGLLTGAFALVLGADIADAFLVRAIDSSGKTGVYLMDSKSEGAEISPYPLIDGRGAAAVKFQGAASQLLGGQASDTGAALETALAIGALAAAADSLGVITLAFEVTLEYLKTRVQFGRPIGSNQVLQHRAVDMHIRTAEARSAVAAAVNSASLSTQLFQHHVHAAKAITDLSARRVVHEAIQMHGGIGIADEHIVGQCLRRIMVNEHLFGQRCDHLKLFVRGLSEDFDAKS
jgi:alkylation response protein AidB-like acyl-CoA dehydrogenase